MQDAQDTNRSFLVELKNNCNSMCGNWSASTRMDNEMAGARRYVRLRCKSWKCPRCGPRRAKQVRFAISKRATELDLTRLLTLTIGQDGCSPEQSVEYIRNCWSKLRVYLHRTFGEAIKFIGILEFQKNGYAHLHVLVDRYIDFAWIQKNWQAVGGGHRVNIKKIDTHRIGAYLSKYLTKELFLSPYYGKYRRFTTSRGIDLLSKPKQGTWQLVKIGLERLMDTVRGTVLSVQCDADGVLQAMTIAVSGVP